ncbi:unnamed protein product [Protopolystoma xenopodis]|uniref:G domain-containing protein n=1 Tax=Protopolystoma xenopodis TaxID=117903 RepID=A0A3S5AP66_9PLAT|nr:unnamed protein product [Protopolystoma xenopodis]
MPRALAFGRSLVKESRRRAKASSVSFPNIFKLSLQCLHTTVDDVNSDYGRLPVRSITESDTLSDFFSLASLSNQDFNAGTTKEELNLLEKDAFLAWRRELSRIEESHTGVITPYEKNLEFWRQLWRVIERSDVLVQIVDARQPLLFYCEDLSIYLAELDLMKKTILMLNKSDLLSYSQRKFWCDYFSKKGIRVVFWSAQMNHRTSLQRSDILYSNGHLDDIDHNTVPMTPTQGCVKQNTITSVNIRESQCN